MTLLIHPPLSRLSPSPVLSTDFPPNRTVKYQAKRYQKIKIEITENDITDCPSTFTSSPESHRLRLPCPIPSNYSNKPLTHSIAVYALVHALNPDYLLPNPTSLTSHSVTLPMTWKLQHGCINTTTSNLPVESFLTPTNPNPKLKVSKPIQPHTNISSRSTSIACVRLLGSLNRACGIAVWWLMIK